MNKLIRRTVLGAALLLAAGGFGCAQDHASSASVAQASRGNSGSYSVAAVGDPLATMRLDGTFYMASRGDGREWRREVLKFTPLRSGEFAANQTYSLVAAANGERRGGSLSWQINPAKRLFRNGQPSLTEPTEPVLEVIQSGTVATTGTAPIVIVKRATIASEGTKFAVEAVQGDGWTLAVFEATSDAWVYYAGSTAPMKVQAGKCFKFPETANSIDDARPAAQTEYDRMYDYAKALWAATGTTNY